MSRRLLTLAEVRALTSVVVPAYFTPGIPESTVGAILEAVLADSSVYCEPRNLLVVVDRGTVTEEVVARMGVPVCRLDTNRGKGGAIRAGLQFLTRSSDSAYVATRDCDGDHALEDLPRLVSLARDITARTRQEKVMVMGARPSLAKPMGWVREEWERLTNRALVDLVEFVLARAGGVLDRRFWGGLEPDIQSGYRVYSQECVPDVIDSLGGMPDDPAVWTFACEFLPFADLLLKGVASGQVQRMTLVEQPVTSYGKVDLAKAYGSLLSFVAGRYGISPAAILRMFDNHIPASSLFFTDGRTEIQRARLMLDFRAGEALQCRFL